MTTLTVEKLLGHSLPPYGPHTITAHLPGWQSAVGIRDGDKTLLSQLKSIYPRFTPWGHAREVSDAIVFVFTNSL
jgi:cystathionine gamma-synthase